MIGKSRFNLGGAGPWLRGLRTLLGFAFEAAPRDVGLFLGCGAIIALFGPVSALGAKFLVDAVLAKDLTAGIAAAVLLSVCGGASLLLTLFYLDFLFGVAERTSAVVSGRLMVLVAGLPGLEHHERPEFLQELDLLTEQQVALSWMTNAIAGLLRTTVGFALSMFLVARLDPLLLLLPLLGVVGYWSGRQSHHLQQKAAEATIEAERLRRRLFEIGTSAAAGKEIRLFDFSDSLVRRHHEAAGTVMRERNRADWKSALMDVIGAPLYGLGFVGVLAHVLYRAVGGQLTPGDVVLVLGVAAGLNGVVQSAVGYATNFRFVMRVVQRFLWLEDYASRSRRPNVDPLIVPTSLRRGIDLQNLSFHYPGTETPVLDRVSVHLPAGMVVGLVGENGAGKSTLVKLLCRFYEPDAGQVLVDGVDLCRFPVEDWRARVSTAFQDFNRFELKVQETVGVGDVERIDDRPAVLTALNRVGLDDFTSSSPLGLETQLGRSWPSGVELSGGQWQKLALSRSFMRSNPLLLVFDEPSAALDAPTEHALFDRMSAAARQAGGTGTITLLVTHRFSTVRMADLILVMVNGRIVEIGDHRQLLAARGLYAELFEIQARSYQ